jgi:hypothetical protein
MVNASNGALGPQANRIQDDARRPVRDAEQRRLDPRVF